MRQCILILFSLAFIAFASIDGARILGLFTIPSISHQVVYRALMKQLHRRGHEIVVFTTDPIRDPNLKNYAEIDLSPTYKIWEKRISTLAEKRLKGANTFSMFLEFVDAGLELCEFELNLPEVKEFMKDSGSHFDVVLIEPILSPCFFVIAHKLKAPYMGVTSLPPTLTMQTSVGNPVNPAYMPDLILGYSDHLTFLQRLHSFLHYIAYRLLDHFWILPTHDALVRKIFRNISMPYIEEFVFNVSVVLANYHFSLYYPRPNVPNMVEITGLHLSTPRRLPKDLQEFLDTSSEGVIYFSLGTNVRSNKMSMDKIKMFIDAFSELPQFGVLWKWDGDEMLEKPTNVKTAKWFPQQDVLAHPKIKVFMYQGGLQSTEEAIKVQVPVIGIPFFADQDINIKKLVDVGAGISMEFNEINKELILRALNKVIYDPLYKHNMAKLSNITKDQPETAMERAVWWTEYVIRHKGAPHLRCASTELMWYQYLLLDVISFLTIISIVTVWGTRHLVKVIQKHILYICKNKDKSH